MKPLDIILTPEGNVAIVTEVCIMGSNTKQGSIFFPLKD